MTDAADRLTDNKTFDLSKFKAFEDDNLNVPQIVETFFHKVENVVEKGENAGNQHFLLFLQ